MDFKPFKMGKYLLMERLATGGMAEVYRAKAGGAGGFEKQVAIKRILPSYSQNDEFRKMFEYEARLSSMLTHANIVQVYDFNKFGETYLLAMEFVDGKNLRQFVNKARKVGQPVGVELALFITNEVCKGLEYAHAKRDDMTGKPLNIIHRDMSPQNIMLSYEGSVKIVDFGIAKAKDRVDETRSGIIKGKFGYMSPEQANGMPVDHRTDIFSTGIILWELLTGRRLFSAESDMATLRMIQECVITPPSKFNPRVTPDLDRIVMKVLSKDLKLRYSNAGDLHRALLEYLSKTAPGFTQREVAAVVQRTFSDDITKEKKRFEQLYRQSIPFSQGATASKHEESMDSDGMDEIEEALDGMQTKSDVLETTGRTISELRDESDVESTDEDPPAPDPTQVSYDYIPEDDAPANNIDDSLTKSHIVENEAAPAVPEPEPAPEVSVPIPEVTPPPAREGTQPGTEIRLKTEGKDYELVLPGGDKHGTGTNKPSVSTIAEEKKEIVAPDAKEAPVELLETEDPSVSEVSTIGRSIRTESQTSFQAPPPQPRAQAPETMGLDAALEDNGAPPPRARPQNRNWRDERPLEQSAQRSILPRLLGFFMVLGATGYVYKLYLNGSITEWIEANAPREPMEVSKPANADEDRVEAHATGDCQLNVRSQPPTAEVLLNGASQGYTPKILTIPCGKAVAVVLRKEGYDSLSENVETRAKSLDWSRTLTPQVRGTLSLSLGFIAEIYAAGEKIGDADAGRVSDFPLRAKQTHAIRIVNIPLEIDFTTDVTIEEGQKTWLKFSLDEATVRSRKKR